MAITPGRYVDNDAIFHPTVAHGAVTLHPSLVASDDVFLPDAVSSLQLQPHLVTDTDTFRVPVVTRGPVTAHPSLVPSDDDLTTGMVTADPAHTTLLVDPDHIVPPFVVNRRGVRARVSVVAGIEPDVELIGGRD